MNDRDAASVLRIAHHHPGRLRVRAAAFVDGGSLAERTRGGLVRLGGVRSVVHDPRTGSLLVEYEPRRIDADALVDAMAELSGLDATPLDEGRPEPGAALIAFVRRLDAITRGISGGRVDLGVLVPGGLAALGVYSFLKASHARLPRWDNLVFWSYAVFRDAYPGPRAP